MSNVFRLGEECEVNLYAARGVVDRPDAWFPVVIAGFVQGQLVHVRAVNVSDDVLVDNEWNVPFRALRRKSSEA